ncbi:CbiQ family ECF transporter T component [Streptomyces sp. NPDC005526]|uniref:CbiQ family ECF transporter T component n=1 Tax=Streptomyces sp. NPDC005526 TaxID=3156885 RepID=UPI0033B63C02
MLPRGRRSVTVAAFAAALLSVPAAAVAFTLIYALGGTTDVAIGKVATAMTGVHVLIGLGEAAITALTVGALIAARPDLVYGARRMRIARESRGFEARGIRHWGVLARSAGALFIRSYERGERVHLAMVSRGYAGAMPVIDEVTASRAPWSYALALPFAALVVCLPGWIL